MWTPRVLAIWALASLFAVGAGPFGTFSSMSVGQRMLFWPAVVSLSVILGFAGHALSYLVVRQCRPVTRLVLEGGFATVLVSTATWNLGKLGVFSGAMMQLSFAELISYVALVAAVVVSIRAIVAHSSGLGAEAAPPPPAPRLARRLPDALGDRILHLWVKDHCVFVVTDRGEECLRMRLTDAIDEMDEIEGYRVHRSHWVARAAISRGRTDRGRAFLDLVNDSEVPVSRNYRPVLEKAGLL